MRQMSPKKKRSLIEFTYILPFLLLVAVFSYFPLYGWIYAFHDFVPPKPISNETFVGLKWFTILFSNPVRSADVLRVMRNTLAMSGISLFFSWFPMIFAVFLNEIKSKPYRKFVQTATTLPNFISWVLVFSIALRRRGGQGPHLAKRWEPRGFSRVAAAFSSYNGDLSLPLGLALGSPIFPSGCEGKLGVALESLQGLRDLT